MSLLQQQLLSLKNEKNSGVEEYSSGIYKSYSDIYLSSQCFASLLSELKNKIVTVVLQNSIEYIELLTACQLSGNIFNPVPYFTSKEELKKICSYIEPEILLTTREELVRELADVNVVCLSDIETEVSQDIYKEVDGSAIASLYYSSGTTGNPKGVLYSHDNIYHLIVSINKSFGFKKETRHLSLLPFGHTASINYNIYPCLFNKSPLTIIENFTVISPFFFKILSDKKINYVQVVPTIVLMLLKIKYDLTDCDLSELMFIGCGSSILPKETQEKFESTYNVKVGNLYGLSETGPSHIDDPRKPDWKAGSIGNPLDVNECRLSENGEILLKGKNLFSGYYKNNSLYNEVVIDGWFNTGDIAEFKNGQYYYLDRSKDLIIKGGINIVPAEVEEIIYKHNLVHEAVVVGVNDEVHGEDIIAAITLKEDVEAKESVRNELYDILSQYLSSYKHPKFIHFLESIPKTHSGKLLRREVKEIVTNEFH